MMLRKRDDDEGRTSPRTGAEAPEGRMAATSGGEARHEGRMSATPTSTVPTRSPGYGEPAGERLGRRVDDVATQASERLSRTGTALREKAVEVKDVTSQKLGHAGEVLGEAAKEVEIEEFHLRGNVAGYPFVVDLEDEGSSRYINFELNLETDQGDRLRIAGRKTLPEGMLKGRAGEESGAAGATAYRGSPAQGAP